MEAGDWKAAVMYRSQDMWDEAHRVGLNHLLAVYERDFDWFKCSGFT